MDKIEKFNYWVKMIEMAITKSQEFRSGQDWANDVIVAANVLANEMERKYKDATTL